MDRRIIDMNDEYGNMYFVADKDKISDVIDELYFMMGRKDFRIDLIEGKQFTELADKVIKEDEFEGYKNIEIKISRHPSFHYAEHWGIWNRDNHLTLTFDDGEVTRLRILEKEEVLQLVQLLNVIKIGIIDEGVFGLDGETWAIEVKWNTNKINMRYWCDIPDNWSNIGKLVKWIRGIAQKI